MKRLLSAVLIGIVVVVANAEVATAAPDKATVLAGWTQGSAASYNAWNAARQNQSAWAQYGFDWETDYCTMSPDNPLGFDFTLACYRHDFGYGNYEALGRFRENKDRVDSAFYEDLKRRCDTYNAAIRPACDSLAWTYYQAVKRLGVTKVDPADIARADELKEAGERAASGN